MAVMRNESDSIVHTEFTLSEGLESTVQLWISSRAQRSYTLESPELGGRL